MLNTVYSSTDEKPVDNHNTGVVLNGKRVTLVTLSEHKIQGEFVEFTAAIVVEGKTYEDVGFTPLEALGQVLTTFFYLDTDDKEQEHQQ